MHESIDKYPLIPSVNVVLDVFVLAQICIENGHHSKSLTNTIMFLKSL